MENHSKWLLLGGITSAVGAVIYIFWGPTVPKRKKDWIPGLSNLGNSCFLNAVLQGLASCSTLITWLDATRHLSSSDNTSLVIALGNILKRLNNNDESFTNGVCSPSEVLRVLTARRWVISNEEQDAHELYHVVTTTLEEELTKNASVLSLLDVKEIEEPLNNNSVLFRSLSRVAKCSFTAYDCPTRGLLASKLTCRTCGFKNPLRLDSFDSISLSIPQQWDTFRLEDFLKEWGSVEFVDNVSCDGCTQLQKQTLGHQPTVPCQSTFVKQLSIVKLPKCLCLHMLRTVWLNNGMASKRHDYVSFPEFLFMDDYLLHKKQKRHLSSDGGLPLSGKLLGGKIDNAAKCDTKLSNNFAYDACSTSTGGSKSLLLKDDSSNNLLSLFRKGEHMYQLKAVLVHIGDTYCGHFVTYRRGPSNGKNRHKWFFTSDTSIREVAASEVTRANAYMLLYEYVTSGKSCLK